MAVAPATIKVEIDFTGNPTAGHNDILSNQDDVTSFWRANSASTFLDSVGTNPGTVIGTPTTIAGPLAYDSDPAVTFNGTSSAVYVPTASNLGSKSNFTAAGWLYLPSLPGATRDTVAKRGAWLVQVNSTGHLIFTLKDDTSTATVTSNSVLTTSTWYHLGFVYDSVNIYIYINGVLDTSTAYTAGWENGYQPIRFAQTPSTAVPVYQSSQTANGVSTTVTVNKPASTVSGEMLLAHIHAGSGGITVPAFTPPAGWTLLCSADNPGANASAARVYYKVAGGSEPASYSWTLSTSSTWNAAISRITSTDTLYPVANPGWSNKTSGTSHSTGAHVPNVDNNMVLGFFAYEDPGSWTESSGTERYDVATGSNTIAMCSQTQASATSITVTGTSSTSDAGSAFMVILAGATPSWLAASFKDWSVENVARDADDLAARYESRNSGVGLWVDVSADVKSVETRGCSRQYERDQIQGGTAAVTLNDATRKYDPTNISSPYYPNVKKNRKIRITATFSGVSYPVFSGFIESWPPVWNIPNYTELTITAGDGFKPLNRAGVSGTLDVGFSGSQIDKLLDKALWPKADRAIDTGAYVMAGVTIATGAFSKPEIDTIVDSELGLFFVNSARVATFHDKAHRGSQTRSTTSQATFRWGGTGEIEYQELTPSDDDIRLTNNWLVSPDTSAPAAATQEVFDHPSIAANFPSTQSRQTRLASNADALSQANSLLNETAETTLRFDSIAIIPTTTQGWQTCLGLTISDRVTVIASPGSSGTTVNRACFIEGTGDWSIRPGPSGAWKVAFPLSPVSSGNYQQTIIRDGPISYYRDDTIT